MKSILEIVNESKVKIPLFIKGKKGSTYIGFNEGQMSIKEFERLKEYLPKEIQKQIKEIIKGRIINVELIDSGQRGENALDYLYIYDENNNKLFESNGIPRTLGKVYNYEQESISSF